MKSDSTDHQQEKKFYPQSLLGHRPRVEMQSMPVQPIRLQKTGKDINF